MEESFFDKWLTGPMATSGPIHYPNQEGAISEKRLGAGAHTDFGCLTMLWQDEVGGLQVKNVNDEWIETVTYTDSKIEGWIDPHMFHSAIKNKAIELGAEFVKGEIKAVITIKPASHINFATSATRRMFSTRSFSVIPIS